MAEQYTNFPHPKINPPAGSRVSGDAKWDISQWDSGAKWVGTVGEEGVNFRCRIALVRVGGEGETFLYDAVTALYDEATYSPFDISWWDVTDRLVSFNTSRGRDHLGADFRPGQGSVTLTNDDGLFNPQLGIHNPGGQELRPGRWIEFSGKRTDSGVWVPLWTGIINSMGDVYLDAANRVNSQWSLIGWESKFQQNEVPELEEDDPVTVNQTTVERVRYLWDTILNYPPELLDTDVAAASSRMKGSTLPGTRYSQFQQAAQAEGGAFYQLPNGKMVFRTRNFWDDEVPLFSIGTANDEIAVLDAKTSWDLSRIQNQADFTREPQNESDVPATQIVQETRSIAFYGRRTNTTTGLQNFTDAEVRELATIEVDNFSWDQLRLDSVDVWASDMGSVDWLLYVDIGDVVEVRVQTNVGGEAPWSYTMIARVNGINHTVGLDDWKVNLRLDNVDRSDHLLGGAFSSAYSDAYDVDKED